MRTNSLNRKRIKQGFPPIRITSSDSIIIEPEDLIHSKAFKKLVNKLLKIPNQKPMITKDSILNFNNEVKGSIEELEREIAECEAKTKELYQKREILGRTYEAIQQIVGDDMQPQPVKLEYRNR